jgi:hypothetical protein
MSELNLMTPAQSIAIVSTLLLLSACSHTAAYSYKYVSGKTATIKNKKAQIPESAPTAVQHAVNAGNRINGKPYIYGGGHKKIEDKGYDCSGTVSYVLYHAGLLDSPAASDEFRSFGEKGKGEWITIYAKRGHVFMVVAGLRLDTGYHENGRDGPKWSTSPRPAKGYVMRHPAGL